MEKRINSSEVIGSNAELQIAIQALSGEDFRSIVQLHYDAVDDKSKIFLDRETSDCSDKILSEELQKCSNYQQQKQKERELSTVQKQYGVAMRSVMRGAVFVVPIVAEQINAVLSLSNGAGYLNAVGTQGRKVPLDSHLASGLATLSEKATERHSDRIKANPRDNGLDLGINSLFRGDKKSLHGDGRTVDFFRYNNILLDGPWNEPKKEQYISTLVSLIGDLPAGSYGIGLLMPKPNNFDPKATPEDQKALIASQQSAVGGTSDDLSTDGRVKSAIKNAKQRGVVITPTFMDQFGHLHLSITRSGDKRA